MSPALYSLIAATYATKPAAGSRCADAEWHTFQDAVHGFWASAAEILGDTPPDHPDFLIAAAVEAQVRDYLKITREVVDHTKCDL